MIYSLRSRRAALRWVASLLLVAGWIVPAAVPHAGGDDVLCVRQGDAEGASSWLGATTGSSAPDHCVVCHTARSFRSVFSDPSRTTIGLAAELILDPPAEGILPSAAFSPLPARAPPSSRS